MFCVAFLTTNSEFRGRRHADRGKVIEGIAGKSEGNEDFFRGIHEEDLLKEDESWSREERETKRNYKGEGTVLSQGRKATRIDFYGDGLSKAVEFFSNKNVNKGIDELSRKQLGS